MASSSNSTDTGSLFFGVSAPTVTGQEVDNDSFIVTSDGTSTGTPSSFWKFDEQTALWVQIPSGGSTCPAPMTRAALLALRASSSLKTECHYTITDHVQGRLVAGTTVTLHAVATNELGERAEVNTAYDNEAWIGKYDIDRALVLELTDNRGNVAKGINGAEVTNFDWGNVAYTNTVVDNATLTVTIGNPVLITNVTVETGATLNLTGFLGSMTGMLFSSQAVGTFTNANGTWRQSTIHEGSTFNIAGYTGGGDNYYNRISGASSVNFSSSSGAVTFRQNEISAQSNVNHTGVSTGFFSLVTAKMMFSSITHSPGAGNFISNGDGQYLSSSGVGHAIGTMTLTNVHSVTGSIQQNTTAGAVMTLIQAHIKQGASVVNSAAGTLSVTTSTVESSAAVQRQAGATGNLSVSSSTVSKNATVINSSTNTGVTTITGSTIDSSTFIRNESAVNLVCTRVVAKNTSTIIAISGSAGTMTLTDVELGGTSAVTKLAASTAGTLLVNTGTKLDSTSFIQTSGIGNLTVSSSSLSGSSGINVTAGNRNYSFTRATMTGQARANLSGTGVGVNDNYNELGMHFRGAFTNSCSGTAITLNYNEINGVSGALNITGTTGSKTIQRVKLYDGVMNVTNNVNLATYEFMTIRDGCTANMLNHSAGQNVRYIDLSTNSVLQVNKLTNNAISYVNVSNGGTYNALTKALTTSSLTVEQGVVTHNDGTISNSSKKMQSTFTVNGGTQNNVHHWSNTNKTTTVNNTSKADYLGVVSTAPIL